MDIYYDLHIHSCLSPCADDDMTPNNTANMAMLCGLDMAALTDHNSVKNCPAFFAACQRAGVVPVAGAEVCTREEVHVLCLFPTLDAGMRFGAYVEKKMPGFVNNPKFFGRQLILDEGDRVVGEEKTLLISACDIGTGELPGLARSYGGVAAPAHIDRPSNSLIANLGFIPPDSGFSCFEIKDPASLPGLAAANAILSAPRARIIHNSDAHSLADINEKRHKLSLREKSAQALVEYLSGS